MARRPPLRDHGAQAERTLLAWTRTCLALAAVGMLLVRLTVVHVAGVLAGLPPLLITSVALYLTAQGRYRRLASGSDEAASALAIAVTGAAVALAGLCALSVLT